MKTKVIVYTPQPDKSIKVTTEIQEVPDEEVYEKYDKHQDNAWLNDPRAYCSEDRLFMAVNGMRV